MKKQNSDEAALKKYTMILPLLDENLDPASAHELAQSYKFCDWAIFVEIY